MADEITNRSFSKYSPFFSNLPSTRVKSRATLGFSAMTSVLPISKVRLVRLPNSDRDSKGQPYRWQLIYCRPQIARWGSEAGFPRDRARKICLKEASQKTFLAADGLTGASRAGEELHSPLRP